jgi:hypothetical protein
MDRRYAGEPKTGYRLSSERVDHRPAGGRGSMRKQLFIGAVVLVVLATALTFARSRDRAIAS